MPTPTDTRPDMLITILLRDEWPAFVAWFRTLTPMRVLRGLGWGIVGIVALPFLFAVSVAPYFIFAAILMMLTGQPLFGS
jgi:hypothetical protein